MKLAIDQKRRHALMRAHSATHILHYALQQHIPETAQAWSLVEEDVLRFDFTTKNALSQEQLQACEDLVNAWISEWYPINIDHTTKDEAVAQWAKAFFEDKYGETVRLVSMHESKELCGWTHCSSTREIWAFVIVGQESVASWIRRITAYTGPKVAQYAREAYDRIDQIAVQLWSSAKHIEQTLEKMQSDLTWANDQLQQYQQSLARWVIGDLLDTTQPSAEWLLILSSSSHEILASLPIKTLSQYLLQLSNERELQTPRLLLDTNTGAFVYNDPAWWARERLTSQWIRGGWSPKLVQGKSEELVAKFA